MLFLIKNRESSKPHPLDSYEVGLTGGLTLFVDTEAVLGKTASRWARFGELDPRRVGRAAHH